MATPRKGTLKGQVRLSPGSLDPIALGDAILGSPEFREAIDDFAYEQIDYLWSNSPVGATEEVRQGWEYIPVKKGLSQLQLEFSIINTSSHALWGIPGRGPGGKPPIDPLRAWRIAVGARPGFEWYLQERIAREGTRRWQSGENWVGINNDGSIIPGGWYDTMKERLQAFLEERFKK